jgi:hypothetical protein
MVTQHVHFPQVFAERWGGARTLSVPAGQRHIGATGRGDNRWIENFDPGTDTCHCSESSGGSRLQGRVTLRHCSPLLPQGSPRAAAGGGA